MNDNQNRDRPLLPVDLARLMLAKVIEPGALTIDATAGNGHDTLFLAEAVGEAGKVFAFDVQEAALVSTLGKLKAAGFQDRVSLHHESHGMMDRYAEDESVAAVMFNLGYLPGGDHAVATGDDTLKALEIAVRLIKPGGAISVICYPGHESGEGEADEVENRMIRLGDDKWRIVKYQALGTLKPAPFLLFAVRP